MKTQLDYQPTFHKERKPVAGIIWRGTRGPRRGREPHHNNPYTTPRTWRKEGELLTYASRDEHGRHYRSCATEWGWREDENRPPYKRPRVIVWENVKTQLDYQPTFQTERKVVAGIIWRGKRGPRKTREPHYNNPYTTPRTWRAEGELFTYASRDEHGQHYHSCAT